MISAFKNAMEQAGLKPGDEIKAGAIIRIETLDKPNSKNGWYRFFDDDPASGVFGDWATDMKQTWTSRNGGSLSAQDRALFAERLKKAEQERQAVQQEASRKASKHFETLLRADENHPYLKKKGVPVYGDIRQDQNRLVIPVKDKSGSIISVQTIGADGFKQFAKDCPVKGGSFLIPGNGDPILCEGYATGATIHNATGRPVIVAFNAGNLVEVARLFPEIKLIAADNDHKTAGNPGLSKAKEAAKIINADVAYPEGISGTDFNDLATEKGIDAVREKLTRQPSTGNRFRLVRIGELKLKKPEYLIHGLLEKDILSLVFGDPGSAKSFIADDMGCCIATGTDFHGHKVKQGLVIFVIGEGQQGVKRRFTAWSIRHGVDTSSAPIFVSMIPGAMCDPDSVETMCDEIRKIAEQEGKPELIVFDTVARNFGPGDENSTQDMTKFIAACDRIRALYQSTVLLVHHSGHGDKSRARGSMALKGALDAEYRLEKDDKGVIRMSTTKMKDAEMPEPMAFKLRSVELPLLDDDGNPVTSAVLDSIEYSPPSQQSKVKGKQQAKAFDILNRLYTEHQGNLEDGDYDPEQARVLVTDWRDACIKEGMNRMTWKRISDNPPKGIEIKNGYAELNLVT